MHLAEVERGGLQSVEEQAGGFGVDLPDDDQAQYLHKRDLDGVGIFKDGQSDGGVGAVLGVEANALFTPILVEVAEAASAECWGAALGAVGFDVSATRDMNAKHDKCSTPPLRSREMNKLHRGEVENL